jgi:hypothetical protein
MKPKGFTAAVGEFELVVARRDRLLAERAWQTIAVTGKELL